MDALVDYLNTLDCISLSLITLPICSIVIVGVLLYWNGNHDTMQRGGNKMNHYTKLNRDNNYQTNSTDSSGIQNTNGHNNGQQNSPNHSNKQRKFRNNNNNNNNNHHNNNNNNSNNNSNKRQESSGGGGQKRQATGLSMNYWYGQSIEFYERFVSMSSCAEDNERTRHNQTHRNSTSSEAAGSDDQQCSSSTEDLSTSYTIMSKQTKKATRSRQRRQQRRRQQSNQQGNANGRNQNGGKHLPAESSNDDGVAMDIDDDTKENSLPPPAHTQRNGHSYHNNSSNNNNNNNSNNNKSTGYNRKQGAGKGEALKAINKNITTTIDGNATKPNMKGLQTSNSNSSVNSTLSSESDSSISISMVSISSITSSVSSSPANSVHSSPTASPTATKRYAENYKKIAMAFSQPFRHYPKFNMSESELVHHLRRYIVDPNLLRVYGYPVESFIYQGCIEIYRCLPKPFTKPPQSNVINSNDGLYINSPTDPLLNNTQHSSSDSGQGSGDSSPSSMDSDSSEVGEDEPVGTTPVVTADGAFHIFSNYVQPVEKICVRCNCAFQTGGDEDKKDYPKQCCYHWGKLLYIYRGSSGYDMQYTCCMGGQDSDGCTKHPYHVWSGAVVGLNGPYRDYVYTMPRYDSYETKIYALDCEMSFTLRGLEVTKVTVIGYDGKLVYEHFVRPDVEIIDYNTRFSGVTEKDLCENSNNKVKTLHEVQRDLLQLFDANTIIIGHGLDNDLRVLRMVHKTIIDTSIVFPHASGFPYRRSLKSLTKMYLNRDIQTSDDGHSSLEDSRACLDLMLWKVRKEMHYDYQQ